MDETPSTSKGETVLPTLVVVKKVDFQESQGATLESFLEFCALKDPCPEMPKILEKVRKYYAKLDPSFARYFPITNAIHYTKM